MSSLSRRFTLSVAFAALAVVIFSDIGLTQDPLQQYDTMLKHMFDAIRSKSYDRFVVDADAGFKAGFTSKMFGELARMLGPKLEKGYSATFLTTLNQQGYVVYVWKLTFKDAKDDYLVTLATKDGKVSGFITR